MGIFGNYHFLVQNRRGHNCGSKLASTVIHHIDKIECHKCFIGLEA